MAKSKKTFSDGLDSMVEFMLYEDNIEDSPYMLDKESVYLQEQVQEVKKVKKKKSKSFSDELSAFFDESNVDVTIAEISGGLEQLSTKVDNQITLDALIRKTANNKKATSKRITLTLNTKVVDKLQSISRVEQISVPRLMEELILEYLQGQKK